jgi:hypothetical protein
MLREEKKLIMEIARDILIANIVRGNVWSKGKGFEKVVKTVEKAYNEIQADTNVFK